MSDNLTLDELVFNRADCYVNGVIVDRSGDGQQRGPRWGSRAGNIVNNRIPDPEELNEVVVVHAGTGLAVTEGRFQPARNKELAFTRLEALVNEYIKEVKAVAAAKNNE